MLGADLAAGMFAGIYFQLYQRTTLCSVSGTHAFTRAAFSYAYPDTAISNFANNY